MLIVITATLRGKYEGHIIVERKKKKKKKPYGAEGFINQLKGTQVESSGARIWPSAVWLQSSWA